MSIYLVLLVGIGGAVGSIFRYILAEALISFSPWVTVFINTLGGFVIGFGYRFTVDMSSLEPIRAFLIIGLCGGFTTFSAFGLDFFHLLKNEQIFLGILYIFSSVIGTILAVYLGIRSVELFS